MGDVPRAKPFTVEIRANQGWNGGNGNRAAAVQDHSGVTATEILAAIDRLAAQIASNGGADAEAPAAEASGATNGELKELQILRIEIARIVKSFGQTKAEIAAIKHPRSDDDRLQVASTELDAIVLATEAATNDILDASESIAQLNEALRSAGLDDDGLDISDQISALVVTIMQACNFQDVTGQRITKVTKILQFIEDRIKAIIGEIGIEAFEDLPVPKQAQLHSSDEHVSGPATENEGISQSDIDALFD